ncbi:hypothetical protein ACEPPN_006524 [Leptodophora sp. 'Broadleaf-Isolate-01']
MSPSDSSLQFHLFRELPGELRELIWKFSLRRTIRVQLQLEARGIPTLSPEHPFESAKNPAEQPLPLTIASPKLSAIAFIRRTEGEAALLEYTKLFGLRPLDVKTFAMHISAFAASQFPGPPMKVYWSRQQTIDRANGTSE